LLGPKKKYTTIIGLESLVSGGNNQMIYPREEVAQFAVNPYNATWIHFAVCWKAVAPTNSVKRPPCGTGGHASHKDRLAMWDRSHQPESTAVLAAAGE
jgi:hypothetical protein